MKKLLPAALFFFAAVPAAADRIECITPATVITETVGATTVDLSATAGQLENKTITYNFEIYSGGTNSEAESSPATCTAADTTVITCNGFDGASVELWWKCDRNAPWGQMENTATLTASAHIGRALSATKCLVRLRLIGGAGNTCMYLAITGGNFKATKEVQDESSSGQFVTDFD